jgi:hypothetical protein
MAITRGFLPVWIRCEIKKIRGAVQRGDHRPGAGRKKKPRASEISPNHHPKPGAGALSATAIAALGEELIVRFLGELAAVIVTAWSMLSKAGVPARRLPWS